MLTELRVRNLALIAAADLEFGPGLTVLSGETGAGKTALLSSLKLLIGERGDASMVGSDQNEARVEALFTDLAYEAEQEQSRAMPASEHLIVRRITSEGRSRCYLDDSLVTVGKLGETLGPHVDLYGQHEHQSLLKPLEQLRMLDAFGGAKAAAALQAYRSRLQEYHAQRAELEQLVELSQSSGAEREQAAFVLREIEKVAPQAGEHEALEQELPRLQNGEQLAESAQSALECLRGEQGALEKLATALQALEAQQGVDATLDERLECIQSLSLELEEAVIDLARYASRIEYDAEVLQVALDRLGELDGLSRRFGPGMPQVFALKERSEQLLQSTENTEEHISKAHAAGKAAKKKLEEAAASLASVRAHAIKDFTQGLNQSIEELALRGSCLEFSVAELDFEKWGNNGSQSFELLYRPAPNASARPLAKIASGGELSRVMLAIKSLMQNDGKSMCLVFDEIDAGIGGTTAYAVALRLASLAENHQVIAITHLAQIAARAHTHFLVSKHSTKDATHTTISALEGFERVQEIARMLSGSSNKEAIAHAQKLLEEAGQ